MNRTCSYEREYVSGDIHLLVKADQLRIEFDHWPYMRSECSFPLEKLNPEYELGRNPMGLPFRLMIGLLAAYGVGAFLYGVAIFQMRQTVLGALIVLCVYGMFRMTRPRGLRETLAAIRSHDRKIVMMLPVPASQEAEFADFFEHLIRERLRAMGQNPDDATITRPTPIRGIRHPLARKMVRVKHRFRR